MIFGSETRKTEPQRNFENRLTHSPSEHCNNKRGKTKISHDIVLRGTKTFLVCLISEAITALLGASRILRITMTAWDLGKCGHSQATQASDSNLTWNTLTLSFKIDLVTVFDAILTSRQMREKLQCLYDNLMSNNFRKTAVLKKISIVN